MTGPLPEAVARAYTGFEGVEPGHGRYYAALSTLAMGDRSAVSYGQTSHVALLLKTGLVSMSELLSLDNRPSRGSFLTGICIDDLVTIEKTTACRPTTVAGSEGVVKSDRSSQQTLEKTTACRPTTELESEGLSESSCVRSSDVLKAIRKSYAEAGLARNPDKAFEGEEQASFWRARIDGNSGDVRALPTRTLPLISLTLDLVRIGMATRGLLEVVAGCYVAVFSFRRRLLSCMELTYTEGQGLPRQQAFTMTPALKDELLLCALLAPIAAANLRTKPSPWLSATDASLDWQAEVRSWIGEAFGQELARHSLIKPVWNKLLRPTEAAQRAAGLLDPEEELPDSSYTCHPLWIELATVLKYEPVWRKPCQRGKHINVSELQSALRAEARHVRSCPCTRANLALDSQVALGALLTGRSSSRSLNKELRKSLPAHLGYGSLMNVFYYPSDLNAADDPTRDRPVRATASSALPAWLSKAFSGDFEESDKWLEKNKSLPEDAVGLPPVSDLVGVEYTPLPRAKQRSSWMRAVREGREPPKVGPVCRQAAELNAELPQDVVDLLSEFPDYQFVTTGGLPPDRTRKGFVDLYSGSFGVARATARLTGVWVLTFELRRSADENLLCPALQRRILHLIGAFYAVGGGPVCSSMSRAIRPPVRSSEEPEGVTGCRPTMVEKVEQGNGHAKFMAACVREAITVGCDHWTENPHTSFLWKQPAWESILEEGAASAGQDHGPFVTDYCRFGARWRKRTRIYTSLGLKNQRLLCCCKVPHLRLSGYSKALGMMMTKAAEPYPRPLNHLLARALAETLKPKRDRHAVDAASIC